MPLGNPTQLTQINASSFGGNLVTASISPAANAFIVASCFVQRAGGTTPVSSVTSTFATVGVWQRILRVENLAGSNKPALEFWRAQTTAAPGSGTVTATWSPDNPSRALRVYQVTGDVNFASPIAQSDTGTGTTTTTPSDTLPGTPAATSRIIAAIAYSGAGVAPGTGSGFTSIGSFAAASLNNLDQYAPGTHGATYSFTATSPTEQVWAAFEIAELSAVAPVITPSPIGTETETGSTTSCGTDTASGTMWAIVQAAGLGTPTATQMKAGQGANGATAPYNTSITVNAPTENFTATGLTADTPYEWWFYQEVAAEGSAVAEGYNFTTADNPPLITQFVTNVIAQTTTSFLCTATDTSDPTIQYYLGVYPSGAVPSNAQIIIDAINGAGGPSGAALWAGTIVQAQGTTWSPTATGLTANTAYSAGFVVTDTNNTTGTTPRNFSTLSVPVPTISSVSPTNPYPGQGVTVNGSNFGNGTGQSLLTYDGITVPVFVWGPGVLTVTAWPTINAQGSTTPFNTPRNLVVRTNTGVSSAAYPVSTTPRPNYSLYGVVQTNDTGVAGIFDNDNDNAGAVGETAYGVWSTEPTDISQQLKGVFNGVALPSNLQYQLFDGTWSNIATESFEEQNQPPVWSALPAQNLFTGQAVNLDLSAYVTSADPITGYAIASGSLPAGLSLNTGTGAITGTVTSIQTLNTTFSAASVNGSTNSGTLAWVITAAPVVPVWGTIPAINRTVGQAANVQLATYITAGDLPITYSVNSGTLPAGVNLNPSTGALTGTLTTVSTPATVFRATNAAGFDLSNSVQWTVVAAPVAPVWTTIPAQPFTVGDAVNLDLSTYITAGDLPITYTANQLPAGLSITGSVVSGTVTTAQSVNTVFTATNAAGASPSNSVAWTISAVPVAPAWRTLPAQNWLTGQLISPLDLSTWITAGDTPITYTVDQLPAGLVLAGRIVSGTPTTVQTLNSVFTATNAVGSADSAPTPWTITAAPQAPVWGTIPQQSFGVGDTVSLDLSTYITVGDAPITYSVTTGTLPTGLSLNPSTGLVSGTVTTAQSRSTVFRAVNATGAANSNNVGWTISAVLPPPVLTSPIPNQTVNVQYPITPVNLDLYFSGEDFYFDDQLPPGITLAQNTGLISGTPTSLETDFPTVAQASNISGVVDSNVFLWNVLSQAALSAPNSLNIMLPDGATTIPRNDPQITNWLALATAVDDNGVTPDGVANDWSTVGDIGVGSYPVVFTSTSTLGVPNTATRSVIIRLYVPISEDATTEDLILFVTGGPTVNDGLFAWYGAQGGTGTTLMDRERSWLERITFLDPNDHSINDMWKAHLIMSGYQGTLNDMLRQFWYDQAGASGGGLLNVLSRTHLIVSAPNPTAERVGVRPGYWGAYTPKDAPQLNRLFTRVSADRLILLVDGDYSLANITELTVRQLKAGSPTTVLGTPDNVFFDGTTTRFRWNTPFKFEPFKIYIVTVTL